MMISKNSIILILAITLIVSWIGGGTAFFIVANNFFSLSDDYKSLKESIPPPTHKKISLHESLAISDIVNPPINNVISLAENLGVSDNLAETSFIKKISLDEQLGIIGDVGN